MGGIGQAQEDKGGLGDHGMLTPESCCDKITEGIMRTMSGNLC